MPMLQVCVMLCQVKLSREIYRQFGLSRSGVKSFPQGHQTAYYSYIQTSILEILYNYVYDMIDNMRIQDIMPYFKPQFHSPIASLIPHSLHKRLASVHGMSTIATKQQGMPHGVA